MLQSQTYQQKVACLQFTVGRFLRISDKQAYVVDWII